MRPPRLFRGALAASLALVLGLAAAHAQPLRAEFSDDIASRSAVSGSALKASIARSLTLDADRTHIGRLLAVRLDARGEVADSYLSDRFFVLEGSSTIPASALPRDGWFPDGTTPADGAALGGWSWWPFGGSSAGPPAPLPCRPAPPGGETREERQERLVWNYAHCGGPEPPDWPPPTPAVPPPPPPPAPCPLPIPPGETPAEARERIMQNFMMGCGDLPPGFRLSLANAPEGSSIVMIVLPEPLAGDRGRTIGAQAVGVSLR